MYLAKSAIFQTHNSITGTQYQTWRHLLNHQYGEVAFLLDTAVNHMLFAVQLFGDGRNGLRRGEAHERKAAIVVSKIGNNVETTFARIFGVTPVAGRLRRVQRFLDAGLLLFLLPLALSGRRLPARFVPFFARIAIAHLESGLLCRFIIDDVQLDVVQALTGDNQHIGMPVPAVRGDHDLRCVAILSGRSLRERDRANVDPVCIRRGFPRLIKAGFGAYDRLIVIKDQRCHKAGFGVNDGDVLRVIDNLLHAGVIAACLWYGRTPCRAAHHQCQCGKR